MNQKIVDILKKVPMFRGLSEEEIAGLLGTRAVKTKVFKKGEFVFVEEDVPDQLMILLSGEVLVAKDTLAGNRRILTKITDSGDMFGEIYTFMELTSYEMYAECLKASEILFIDRGILELDPGQNRAVQIMCGNLLKIFATKAYRMNKRLRILSSLSIREKIARFLIENQGKERIVMVPPREEMADYLNVTRPSLSRELMNMATDGIIEVNGREVRILRQESLEEFL